MTCHCPCPRIIHFMFKRFFTKPTRTWSLPYDPEPLRRRLAELPPTDALFPLLTAFLDATIVSQSTVRVADSASAQQLAGRLNMVADLKADWQTLWVDTHKKQ